MADRYDANIDAFWDCRNGQAGATPVLDAELAATIQQLHLLYASSPPNSARERVRQRVLDPSSFATENATDMNALALPAAPPARSKPRISREPTVSRRQLWLMAAAVLALLLAGMSGWFLYDRSHTDPTVPAAIPAVQESTPTTDTNDWPMYRGNPGRTGNMPGSGPKTAPGVVWSESLDGSAYRSPIVVGDTAYVGTASGTLYALDAATGAERWTFKGDGSLEMTPAYQDGIVYVPSQLGTLYAIDAATGSELWTFAEPLAEFATPTFGDGLLFVGSESNNALYGIDPKTGAEVWRFDTAGAIMRGQAYADGVLFSGSEGGILYAVNGKDGSQKWTYDAQQDSIGTPAVADGVVYITSPIGQIVMVDAATGEEIKRIDTTSTDGIAPLTIGNGLVYVGTWAGTIDAVDPDTEQVIWSYPTQQTMRAGLALVDGVIYGVGLDNTVYALDAATGAELWTYQSSGAMDFGPTVAHGMVYVSTEGAEVLALGESGTMSTTSVTNDPASPVAGTGLDQAQIAVVFEATGTDEHPLRAPQGMAIAPNGNLYVVNALTDTVEIFSPEGEWIESIGSSGSEPGQFRFHRPGDPSGLGNVGFDADGNLYVFDTFNNRVQKFSPDHTFLLEWGTLGSGNGEFDEVTGAIDSSTGRVYVTDLGNRVQVFDLDGNFLDKWGSTGSGPAKFRKPTNVAVDSKGNIYIAEEEGRRVQKFDSFGAFLDSTGQDGAMEGDFGEIFALAIDANDNLYVASYTGDVVRILAPDGALIGTIERVEGAGALDQPSGLTIGPDGALYIVEEGNNRILKVQLPPLEA